MDNKEILKIATVYNGILEFESQVGLLLPLDDLKRFILKYSSSKKINLNKKEIEEILNVLIKIKTFRVFKKKYRYLARALAWNNKYGRKKQ